MAYLSWVWQIVYDLYKVIDILLRPSGIVVIGPNGPSRFISGRSRKKGNATMNRRFLSIYVFAGVVLAFATAILGVVFDTKGTTSPGGDFCLPIVDYPNTGSPCTASIDALRGNAIWGGLLAIAIMILIGGVYWINNQNAHYSVWIIVGSFVAGLLVGAYVLANLSSWLEDRDILTSVFWRGFAATVVVILGGLIVASWERINPDPVL